MNCNSSIFLDLPYPTVKVSAQDPASARILFPIYAGAGSELTAIAQYVYQSIVTADTAPALSDTLECVAMTEMKHFDILGKLILMLGANPKLFSPAPRSRRPVFWNGSYPNYSQNPSEILDENIRDEEEGARAYAEAARRIPDPDVKAVLLRLRKDELHHAEIFRNLRDSMES